MTKIKLRKLSPGIAEVGDSYFTMGEKTSDGTPVPIPWEVSETYDKGFKATDLIIYQPHSYGESAGAILKDDGTIHHEHLKKPDLVAIMNVARHLIH